MGRHSSLPRSLLSVSTPLARPGQRVGLMGGSFNPPHEGHLMVAQTALRRLALDELWWLVTPGNPLKPQSGLLPLEARLDACERLARGRKLVVTGFEADLGCAYTATTLRFLVKRFPATHFVWVMGADNLATFHRWRDWRGIAGLMPIAVIDRPQARFRALASTAGKSLDGARVAEHMASTLAFRKTPAWTYLSARLSPLSSSVLRRSAQDA